MGRRKERARAVSDLVAEIGEQRASSRDLFTRFEQESAAARDAVAATARAREERDEYRRVLAAAIGSERREAARVEALEADRLRLEADARDVYREIGAASARHDAVRAEVDTLQAELERERAAHQSALADASDRAWSEREAARSEMVRLVASARQESTELASEVRAAMEAAQANVRAASQDAAHAAAETIATAAAQFESKATVREQDLSRIQRMRAWLCVALAVAATLVGVAFTPMAVLSAMDAERAAFLNMATHLTPMQLMGATVLSFAAAVALLTLARRDLAQTRPGGTSKQSSASGALPSGRPVGSRAGA